MLCREIIAVCSEIHTKHINTVCGQNVELLIVKLVVHLRNSQLMLYRKIIAVFSQINKKRINTLCGLKVELLNVKLLVHIVTTVRYIQ